MNETNAHALAALRRELERHRDAAAASGIGWLTQALDLMGINIASVPPPDRETEAIPEYIYPH